MISGCSDGACGASRPPRLSAPRALGTADSTAALCVARYRGKQAAIGRRCDCDGFPALTVLIQHTAPSLSTGTGRPRRGLRPQGWQHRGPGAGASPRRRGRQLRPQRCRSTPPSTESAAPARRLRAYRPYRGCRCNRLLKSGSRRVNASRRGQERVHSPRGAGSASKASGQGAIKHHSSSI